VSRKEFLAEEPTCRSEIPHHRCGKHRAHGGKHECDRRGCSASWGTGVALKILRLQANESCRPEPK
jgi:hypothetical protein